MTPRKNNSDLSLKKIVTSFCAPIKEEHAWALIFMGMTRMIDISQQHDKIYLIRSLDHLQITGEGDIKADSFTEANDDQKKRRVMTNLATGIAELATTIYDALDWELPFERQLSSDLEELIEFMISADDAEQEDEGISIGEDEMNIDLCEKIFDSCRRHHSLVKPEDAPDYYKQVCQALVAEVKQLSSLMSTLTEEDLQELEMLERREWAGVFNMVMDELRNGVKLNKVDNIKDNSEFTMTPYEMLMADIKSKKAVLKRPPSIPRHVELAARDQIMNFIKSKPQLRPVSERVLASPVADNETPVEKLMSDIRTGKARRSLRRSREPTSSFRQKVGRVAAVHEVPRKNVKQIIPLDEKFLNMPKYIEDETPENSADEEGTYNDEDEIGTADFDLYRLNSTKERFKEDPANVTLKAEKEADVNEDVRTNYEEVSLHEFCHIRTKETLAQLDQKDLSKTMKKDLNSGKLCFICGKTRFYLFFGGNSCQICNRQVCKNCCNKMKFPNRNLENIPLSSYWDIIESEDESEGLLTLSPFSRNSASRGSLKLPSKVSGEPPVSSLSRSKTLTREQAKKAQEKARTNAYLTPTVSMTSGPMCFDCKDVLASLVMKKSSRSPKKRTIFDIQSVTISKYNSKRRSSISIF